MKVTEKTYLAVEDLEVYRKLCQLHLDVCELTYGWPAQERYELGGQARRSSNSAPAQLAEKNDDRHVRNKIEGVNRSRGEAGETVHHPYMALLKEYINEEAFRKFQQRYQECIRMLNGLERTLEQKLPAHDRRWHVAEDRSTYDSDSESCPPGWPSSPVPEFGNPKPETRKPTPETRHLTPDT